MAVATAIPTKGERRVYLEKGRCAHCGKRLDDTATNEFFNYELDKYAQDKERRPYFCSKRCVERAIDLEGIHERVELSDDADLATIKWKAGEYDDVEPYSPEGQELLHGFRREYAEAQKKNRERRDETIELDYRVYFTTYATQVHQRDVRESFDELDKKITRNHITGIVYDNPEDNYYPFDFVLDGANRGRDPDRQIPAHPLLEKTFNKLIAQLRHAKTNHDWHSNEGLAWFRLLRTVADHTRLAPEGLTIGETPLLLSADDPLAFVVDMFEHFDQEPRRVNLRRTLGIPIDGECSPQDEVRALRRSKLPPEQLARAIFAGYPVYDFLMTPVPITIPDFPYRFDHTHILGASGSGKTTLIQEMILGDLDKPDPPGMVIIDPKGLLTKRLSHLAVFDRQGGRLQDRIIVLDATSPHPPILGLFQQGSGHHNEQIINQAISTYSYIFAASNFKFTPKQSICFNYGVRLMFEMGGDLTTLMRLMRWHVDPKKPRQPSEFDPYIDHLPADARETQFFFRTEFHDAFSSTKDEVNVRLHQIMQRPSLRAIFDQRERRVDFFDAIQQRKIILVNTGLAHDQVTSQMLGRFAIAMTMNAAYVRSTLPESEWHPTFLYCDEFQEFVDEGKTPEMLRLAREYNVGIIMAHHNMFGPELTEPIRVTISTNTGIKFAADPRGRDLSYVTQDFGCEPEFLSAQRKTATHAKFALSVRGLYDKPISVSIPFLNIEKRPQMTEKAHDHLMRRNTRIVYGDPWSKAAEEKAARSASAPNPPADPDRAAPRY